MSYAEATAVSPIEEGVWEAEFAENWDILGNTNGGYMQAIASRASSEACGGRHPVSITGHFTSPGHTGPARVETELVRHGRRFSVVRSRTSQGDRVVLETLGSFIEPDDHEPEVILSDATPLELPPLEDCVRAVPAVDAPFPPPSVGQVDLRIPPRMAGLFEGRPLGEPRMEGWFRLNDDEPLDPHSLIVACDAFPPTTFNAGLPIGWTPTLDLTVYVRYPQATGWIRCELRSRFVSGGFIEEDGLFWDDNDRLVGQSRQLALVAR